MRRIRWKYLIACLLVCAGLLTGCSENSQTKNTYGQSDIAYSIEDFPLERNDITLHLDQVRTGSVDPEKNMLLMHGVTYASHEFDVA